MALEEPLQQIIDAVKETLDRTPPELAWTSWTAASCSRAVRCRGSTSACATRRRCPLTWPSRRSPAWRWIRSQPRGVRGHPPRQQEFPNEPAAVSAGPGGREACTTGRRSGGGGRPGRLRRAVDRHPDRLLRRVGGGFFHALQRGAQEAFAPIETARRRKPVATCSAGWATPSTPRTRTRSSRRRSTSSAPSSRARAPRSATPRS